MSYEINFGSIRAGGTLPVAKTSGRFRIAVLGDFSARAQGGKLETGASLAARKPFRVDCDNLDATLKRLRVKLRLPLGGTEGGVEVAINALDDLHPDQLYASLPIFSELSGLRQQLKTPSTFAKAAQEVQAWSQIDAPAPIRPPVRTEVVRVNAKLSDFARLIGAPTASARASQAARPVAELLQQVVGPYVVPAKDPRQDQLVASVDRALAATMRSVLHHPGFQSFEALWRSVDLLVRRLETDEHLQIVLYDLTAEEMAADLSQGDALEQCGLYKLLVEQPALDADEGAFSLVVANYFFEQTPPHAELLARLAKLVGQTQTTFIAGVGTSCLDTKPADLHRLIRQSWDALAQTPEAAYLGLVLPRFLLRLPYGARTDPIESFDFEEFTSQEGLRGMLWGNAAVLAGLLLGATFTKEGAAMQPGAILGLGEMPFYYYTDADGDQIALPCTERMLSSRAAELVGQHRFMAVLSLKGRPEVRLAGFASLAGGPLAGPWQPVSKKAEPKPKPKGAQPATPTPEPTTPPPATPPAEPPSEAPETPEPASSAPAEDPELDKVLADLTEKEAPATPRAETAPKAEEGPHIDPELAKLLKDLG